MKAFDYARAVRRTKILIIAGCVVTLLVLGFEVRREHFAGEWRAWQSDYRAALAPRFRATFEVGLKQVFLPELGRVDRCQTCHVGIDDPAMAGRAQPLGTHPGDLLKMHPPQDFGCTICHQGQGRATWLPDAHGDAEFWPRPLLRGDFVYTSCGRCHVENSPFGEDTEQFGGRIADPEIHAGDLTRNIPGADLLARGKKILLRSGCFGCHGYRGRGGTIGPDLTHIGDKPIHDFDYSHLPPGAAHTPLAWLEAHFLDPGAVSPGTVMPDFGVAPEEAEALAAYMLSLKAASVPPRYRTASAAAKGEAASGEALYRLFCVACHGRDLAGSQVETILTPSLSNQDFLSVASDDYLERMIAGGRSGTKMPAWAAEGGGLTRAQIRRIVAYIRSFEAKGPDLSAISRRGDADRGRALYDRHCAACHGADGEGGLGTALLSKDFLMLASDAFLARTIVEGRPDEGMPAWRDLSAVQVSDLLAYFRQEQGDGARLADVEAYLASKPDGRGAGAVLYRTHCAECHGAAGEGSLGPSLASKEFLATASDAYLVHAIRDGRPGTAMPAWTSFSAAEVGELVLHLRSLAPVTWAEPVAAATHGDPRYGELLYRRDCRSCHGPEGAGGTSTQLANPVFLEHASEGYLYRAIQDGRSGTSMHGFGGVAAGTSSPPGIVLYTPPQIAAVVAYVRALASRPPLVGAARPVLGDPERGQAVFERSGACIACHGEHGEGAVGPAIGSPRFLAQASQGFVIGTVVLGRSGTQMHKFGSWGTRKLTAEQVRDVAAYVHRLGARQPAAARRFPAGGPLGQSRGLYERHCASCHGSDGKGEKAPSLNNPEFLAAATDGFLVAAIGRGRRGTKMLGFGPGGTATEHLSTDEMLGIVGYLRSWRRPRRIAPGTDVVARGKALFERVGCFTCHGKGGKGGVPDWNFAGGTVPPLNNLAEKMELYEPEEVQAVLAVFRRGGDIEALDKLPPLESLESFQEQYRRVRNLIRDGKKASKRDLKGPPPPLDMPSWKDVLAAADIDAIIAYCLSVQPWEDEDK